MGTRRVEISPSCVTVRRSDRKSSISTMAAPVSSPRPYYTRCDGVVEGRSVNTNWMKLGFAVGGRLSRSVSVPKVKAVTGPLAKCVNHLTLCGPSTSLRDGQRCTTGLLLLSVGRH